MQGFRPLTGTEDYCATTVWKVILSSLTASSHSNFIPGHSTPTASAHPLFYHICRRRQRWNDLQYLDTINKDKNIGAVVFSMGIRMSGRAPQLRVGRSELFATSWSFTGGTLMQRASTALILTLHLKTRAAT
jgi:hypothetical protein